MASARTKATARVICRGCTQDRDALASLGARERRVQGKWLGRSGQARDLALVPWAAQAGELAAELPAGEQPRAAHRSAHARELDGEPAGAELVAPRVASTQRQFGCGGALLAVGGPIRLADPLIAAISRWQAAVLGQQDGRAGGVRLRRPVRIAWVALLGPMPRVTAAAPLLVAAQRPRRPGRPRRAGRLQRVSGGRSGWSVAPAVRPRPAQAALRLPGRATAGDGGAEAHGQQRPRAGGDR
mmetsp:Transcript_107185/g.334109  ORF Transcript_107185/g.334109 Transcript_107185/m.334109 type:complete len:242 (+) Transcript_107185:769-1494(+)